MDQRSLASIDCWTKRRSRQFRFSRALIENAISRILIFIGNPIRPLNNDKCRVMGSYRDLVLRRNALVGQSGTENASKSKAAYLRVPVQTERLCFEWRKKRRESPVFKNRRPVVIPEDEQSPNSFDLHPSFLQKRHSKKEVDLNNVMSLLQASTAFLDCLSRSIDLRHQWSRKQRFTSWFYRRRFDTPFGACLMNGAMEWKGTESQRELESRILRIF